MDVDGRIPSWWRCRHTIQKVYFLNDPLSYIFDVLQIAVFYLPELNQHASLSH
jgi:hypothetical protein